MYNTIWIPEEVLETTISIDFDGVLSNYNGTFSDTDVAPPIPGAIEFLQQLHHRGFVIYIHTCRSMDVVWKWLKRYYVDKLVEKVSSKKYPCKVYLDDRGMLFSGDFDKVLERIVRFEPHWKLPKPQQELTI